MRESPRARLRGVELGMRLGTGKGAGLSDHRDGGEGRVFGRPPVEPLRRVEVALPVGADYAEFRYRSRSSDVTSDAGTSR